MNIVTNVVFFNVFFSCFFRDLGRRLWQRCDTFGNGQRLLRVDRRFEPGPKITLSDAPQQGAVCGDGRVWQWRCHRHTPTTRNRLLVSMQLREDPIRSISFKQKYITANEAFASWDDDVKNGHQTDERKHFKMNSSLRIRRHTTTKYPLHTLLNIELFQIFHHR